MNEFQDLDHIDGVSISTLSANSIKIQEMIWFYFIFEKVQIMLLFIHSQKLYLKISNGI